ncbi:MAG TPA: radical SAM protein [Bacteroidales bacterium]|nr:radical SAM protein [Bacteroidales bacterium]
MNLLLNNYCNLNCEYCFANQVMEKDKQNITIEKVFEVLSFLKNSKIDNFSIIGGEPTLHPNFSEILDITSKQEYLKSVLIFSNGAFNKHILDSIIKLSSKKKVSLLINYNNPEIIGENVNKILLYNAKELIEKNIEVTFGLNIFKHNQGFNYIIEKTKEFGLKNIRWSLVVPNGIKQPEFNVREYFDNYKCEVIEFLELCRTNGIRPQVDCNNIPLCLYDDEEFTKIVFLENNGISACYPIIDILPDLSVVRCFALSEEKKVNLLDFSNKREIEDYFIREIDDKYSSVPLFEECNHCISFKMKNKSCGCIAYKLNKHD